MICHPGNEAGLAQHVAAWRAACHMQRWRQQHVRVNLLGSQQPASGTTCMLQCWTMSAGLEVCCTQKT
jgi:hypothetical protein